MAKITHDSAVAILEMLMRRRGLEFRDLTEIRVYALSTERIMELCQILTLEGKANFLGECEVMDLQTVNVQAPVEGGE